MSGSDLPIGSSGSDDLLFQNPTDCLFEVNHQPEPVENYLPPEQPGRFLLFYKPKTNEVPDTTYYSKWCIQHDHPLEPAGCWKNKPRFQQMQPTMGFGSYLYFQIHRCFGCIPGCFPNTGALHLCLWLANHRHLRLK